MDHGWDRFAVVSGELNMLGFFLCARRDAGGSLNFTRRVFETVVEKKSSLGGSGTTPDKRGNSNSDLHILELMLA